MVTPPKDAFAISLLGGFGAAAIIGGLIGMVTMIAVPLAYGIFDSPSVSLLADPIFYLVAGLAICFAVFAAIGGFASLLAWRGLKELRAGRSDK